MSALEVNLYGGQEHFSVVASEGEIGIGGAELDFWPELPNPVPNCTGPVLWFARLFVKQPYRGKRIGTKLMERVCEEADRRGLPIINCINAYGDMSRDEIRDWFCRRFGFQAYAPGAVYRLPEGTDHEG